GRGFNGAKRGGGGAEGETVCGRCFQRRRASAGPEGRNENEGLYRRRAWRLTIMKESASRCPWPVDDLYRTYHDTEWGVPLHDDRKLFEFLVLEGAQAGLSWHIVLKKRENYRAAFDQFDPEKVARYTPAKIKKLLANPGIIRNRLKIASAVRNARAFLAVAEQFGSFDRYIWRFVEGRPIVHAYRSMKEVPARTKES